MQPPEGTFFITYRLADSLPLAVIKDLKEKYSFQKNLPDNQSQERREELREEYFEAFENALEKNPNEPHWLKNDSIASDVIDSLLFNDAREYRLWSA
ncbi:MAG: hypothetical protein SGI83_15440 [Bacteroidota bacterium]|nr:hypothetical protein [Bacteroidota bacterium]